MTQIKEAIAKLEEALKIKEQISPDYTEETIKWAADLMMVHIEDALTLLKAERPHPCNFVNLLKVEDATPCPEQPPASIQEVLEILEKEEYLEKGVYKRTEGVEKAIAKLRSIKAPPVGEFTKECREFADMTEEFAKKSSLTFVEYAYLLTAKLHTLCDCLDASQASRKELLDLCEEFMERADDGSADFDDPAPGSIFIRAEAVIAKEKVG